MTRDGASPGSRGAEAASDSGILFVED